MTEPSVNAPPPAVVEVRVCTLTTTAARLVKVDGEVVEFEKTGRWSDQRKAKR